MKRSTDRILTTHVGSLIRPRSLLDVGAARSQHQPVDEQAYAQTLRQEVNDVVHRQAEAGIDVVDDGEYGKSGWFTYLMERTTGFEFREVPRPRIGFLGREREERFAEFYDETMGPAFRSTSPLSRQLVCTAPITYTGSALLQRDIDNLKAALAGVSVEEAFLPVIAPASIWVDHANAYYPSERDYLFAVAEALHQEYRQIVDNGIVVQVDDAILLNMYDAVVASGQDYRAWMRLRLDALNHALEGIPMDMVRYHVCWGSWHGPHTSDVPLRDFVDLLLTVNAGAYSIEAANPRHEHEWLVWQDVKLPDDRVLIPGIVSHHTSHVEHPDLIAQRIERFASVVGKERVIAGTDCGFAQNEGLQRQHPSVMWAKFEALAEGARIASQHLWGR